jgi:N-acetylmuramic acid 6-phosphate (MurNAc-6-P) etherase
MHIDLSHSHYLPETMPLPFTERTNPLCGNLDGALPPLEFLRCLRAADLQMYAGFECETSLFSPAIIKAVNIAVDDAAEVIRRGGCIALSGCGTSGRIAFLIARRFERLLHRRVVDYVIAGGDSALLLSDELPEDDPRLGAADMERAVRGRPAYVIGVTCGLSAPYVAGQLADAVSSGLPCAAIGFNPAELARDTAVPLCWPSGKTDSVRGVIHAMTLAHRASLINPVIGPEPVAGSSRMKGGTATAILLDTICLKAVGTASAGIDYGAVQNESPLEAALMGLPVENLFGLHQQAHTLAYAAAERGLPHLMRAAARSVSKGGHLYYIGSGSAGCVGFIDLSEMPDTYGAPFDQARAFVAGGWQAIGNRGGDLSARSALHRVSIDHFREDVLPTLSAVDTVIALISDFEMDGIESVVDVITAVRNSPATWGACCIRQSTDEAVSTSSSQQKQQHSILAKFCSTFRNAVPWCEVALTRGMMSCLGDTALKVLVNAVSTYAQAAGRGALFKGTMIAAGPANDKIYARCVRMIAETVQVSPRDAEIALIRSIYGCDAKQASELLPRPRVEHIKAALLPEERRHEPQLALPVAFLLAIRRRDRGHWRRQGARFQKNDSSVSC